MALLWLIVVLLAVYKCYTFMFERPYNYPPGPPKIPIFGSYFFLLAINYKHLHLATTTLAKWYGTKILGIYYGSSHVMVVHDLDTTKEVLNNPDLDGRPIFPIVEARDPFFRVFGIFFRDGSFWRNQRRFALRHLRDFGFGRRFEELEIHIDEELRDFLDLLRNGPKYDYEKSFVKEGGLVMAPYFCSVQPANVLMKCLLNERIPRKDLGTLYKAGVAAIEFQRNGCMYGRIFSMLECLKYIIPSWSGYKAIRDSSMILYDTMQKIVTDQQSSFDPSHDRHFLDLYFKELQDKKADFSIEQLTTMLIDLVFPATTGPPTVLTLVLQRLLLNPEYMKKCQKQIDDVVGNGRLATLNDRMKLPFVEAVIRETMRLDTLVANNVPHKALRATKVAGYDLQKGGLVLTVLRTANRDEKYFKDPAIFRPDRFIGENGLFDPRLDYSVTFGAGKRVCAGETFSRNLIFLFLCAFLQNFNISIPEGHQLPNPDVNPPITGINLTIPNFYLKFTSR